MQIEPQVSFRNVERTEAVEQKILEGIAKLEKVYDRITSVRIALEDMHSEDSPGHLYRVRIDITLPGGEVVVNRKPGAEPAMDLMLAVGDAFDIAVRKLKKVVQRQRGRVKNHTPRPAGRVARIFENEGYGFIESSDGTEVYFHENAVMNGSLEDLEQGAPVEFDQEQGDKGPQAAAVYPA